MHKKLYYHRTDGGAEYLTDRWKHNPDGSKEGVFKNAAIIVRIDGIDDPLLSIVRDFEITIVDEVLGVKEPLYKHLFMDAVKHLRRLLRALGPCDNFDHHGYCQSHFVESPCCVGQARAFMESLPDDTVE